MPYVVTTGINGLTGTKWRCVTPHLTSQTLPLWAAIQEVSFITDVGHHRANCPGGDSDPPTNRVGQVRTKEF